MCTWRVEFAVQEPLRQLIGDTAESVTARFVRMVIPWFEESGFAVNLLPEEQTAIHVIHARESAMTYFTLRHPGLVSSCRISRLV